MLRFIGDMVIGWIIYTDSGKKVANKVVSTAINHIKKNVIESPQIKEILSFKDIFTKDNDDKPISNDRTKD